MREVPLCCHIIHVSVYIQLLKNYHYKTHVVCIKMSMAIIGSSGALGEFPTTGTSRYPLPSDYTDMPRMANLRTVNEDSNKINEPDVKSPLVENCEDVEQVWLIFISFIFVWFVLYICRQSDFSRSYY